ncbi:MAG TPA: zinc ribbon domain-containing protein, partial [Roseiflexaceae bacterium]
MKCSTCGAENEAANRFCEQCGSRLEPSGAVPQAQVDLAAQPTAAGPTCPSCGAAVLPGEAFCDECGAALSSAVPAATGVGAASGAAYDAPTMIAPPPPAAARGAPVDGHSVVCPACGHQNLPGDRFCDNCGAALPAPAAAGSPAAQAEAPTVLSDQALLQSLHAAAPEPSAAAQAEAPTVEQPAIEPAANAAQEAYEAERRRLTEEVERQQKIITQFEQMQAMFGAATPAAVSQGLAEARDARARAEAELAALQPPPPPVDPAEVARLTEEVERQQKIITQFEQMQAMFG